MLEIILGIATIGGFLLALLTLFPRLTVSNNSAIDLDDPFSTPFVASNDGYLPLYSVNFYVAVREVRLKRDMGGLSGDPQYRTKFTISDWDIGTFSPAAKYSIYAGKIISSQFNPVSPLQIPRGEIESGDIAVIVEYRPLLWPMRRQLVVPFKTQKGPDGKLYWMYSR
jgi:hypothetical protein